MLTGFYLCCLVAIFTSSFMSGFDCSLSPRRLDKGADYWAKLSTNKYTFSVLKFSNDVVSPVSYINRSKSFGIVYRDLLVSKNYSAGVSLGHSESQIVISGTIHPLLVWAQDGIVSWLPLDLNNGESQALDLPRGTSFLVFTLKPVPGNWKHARFLWQSLNRPDPFTDMLPSSSVAVIRIDPADLPFN